MRKYYWEFIELLNNNGYLYRDYCKNDDGTFTYTIDTDPESERHNIVTPWKKFTGIVQAEIPGATVNNNLITF